MFFTLSRYSTTLQQRRRHTEPLDTLQDRCEQLSWNRHFGHLEDHADLVVDGVVGVKDLLFLLGAWGPCPPKGDCPADFDDSGDVGVKDLLTLLGAWGPCP